MHSTLEIIQIEPCDERWLAFAASHAQANIFHHPAWINLLAECYGYRPFIIAVQDDEGELFAGMPIMEVNSFLTSRRWVSLPFSDYCVPLSRDDESLEKLADYFVNAYENDQVPSIELRWELPHQETIQQKSNHVLHSIELSENIDSVAKRFKRSHRQNIRTAEKRGVRVEWGNKIEHMRLYYQLQLETRQRQGVPVQPWRFFELLATTLFEQELGFALLAYKDEECLAGVIFLHWGKYIVAKYAASRADTLKLRPNNLLFWTGIHWGCEHGKTVFDFGRTDNSNSGLCRYKRGWGAVEKPLIYSVLSSKPPNQKNSRFQDILKPVIRKSPLWVCRASGELLYRHYG